MSKGAPVSVSAATAVGDGFLAQSRQVVFLVTVDGVEYSVSGRGLGSSAAIRRHDLTVGYVTPYSESQSGAVTAEFAGRVLPQVVSTLGEAVRVVVRAGS